MSQNLQKWVKYVRFLICVSFFLRFEKFHIENKTGYDFCVLNNLQFQSDHKKAKIAGYTIFMQHLWMLFNKNSPEL